jgi:hypothetical protein
MSPGKGEGNIKFFPLLRNNRYLPYNPLKETRYSAKCGIVPVFLATICGLFWEKWGRDSDQWMPWSCRLIDEACSSLFSFQALSESGNFADFLHRTQKPGGVSVVKKIFNDNKSYDSPKYLMAEG